MSPGTEPLVDTLCYALPSVLTVSSEKSLVSLTEDPSFVVSHLSSLLQGSPFAVGFDGLIIMCSRVGFTELMWSGVHGLPVCTD